MLCSSCSKYGDSFSASFEEFSYFLPSPLAGSLFLFKLLGTFPPSSLLKCARNSCYLSNGLHSFHAFGFNNGEAIEDQGIQESKTKTKITSSALIWNYSLKLIWKKKETNIFIILYFKITDHSIISIFPLDYC